MLADVLKPLPFFRGLADEVLVDLTSAAQSALYPAGTSLFHEDEPCQKLYIVMRGNVRVYRLLSDGKEYTIDLLGGGQLVALVAFLDGGPFPASAETLESSEIVVLPRAGFVRVSRQHPELLERALEVVCTRLRRAHRRETELALRTVHERIASVLLHLLESHEGKAPQLSHEELAHLVGAARETVTRALHDLRRQGAVEMGHHGMVMDAKRLRAWLEHQ